MWVGKFALEDTGTLEWVDLGATAVSGAATLNGAAYHQAAQALFVTTEAVAAADASIGGFRYRADGALRVYDATSAVPAGSSTNQGIALTSDGQLCYTLDTATSFSLNGVSLDGSRRVNAIPLAFLLEFADLGAGVVDTAETIYDTTPTFTRSTAATTVLSSGLIASVASGSPRSYYDPTSLTYLGYLAEGARTNLCLQSEVFDNAAWNPTDLTVSANVAVSPDGASTGDLLTADVGAGGATIVSDAITVVAGSVYTYSVFVKASVGNDIQLRMSDNVTGQALVNFNPVTGVVGTIAGSIYGTVTATTKSYPNGWYRFSITGTQPAAQTTMLVGFYLTDLADAILAWGAQVEAAAFASSYIPTTTAAVTRNADVLTYPTTGWLNAAAGTLFVDFTTDAANNAAVREFFYIDDGTANERIIIDSSSGGLLRGIVTDGGVTQAAPSTGITMAASTRYKAAMAYAANDFAISGNGGTVGTDSSGTLPTVTTANIGTGNGIASFFPIRRVAFFGARLSNATLQALTA